MKYIVSFLLLAVLTAPSMAQRPQRGDFKKQDQRVEKHIGKKGCDCAALKKQVEGLRKRLAEVTKEKGKKTAPRGRRGGRSDRRNSYRGKQRGSRGDTGRGKWTPKKPHGNKQMDTKRMEMLEQLRKRWASRVAGR